MLTRYLDSNTGLDPMTQPCWDSALWLPRLFPLSQSLMSQGGCSTFSHQSCAYGKNEEKGVMSSGFPFRNEKTKLSWAHS